MAVVKAVDPTETRNAKNRIALGVSDRGALGTSSCLRSSMFPKQNSGITIRAEVGGTAVTYNEVQGDGSAARGSPS